jgi:hypothetical protein
MIVPEADDRSPARRALDELIAAEPPLAPLELPTGAKPAPLQFYLDAMRKPLAVPGVVENGVVRPLDPTVKLLEHSRVIIVAAENV